MVRGNAIETRPVAADQLKGIGGMAIMLNRFPRSIVPAQGALADKGLGHEQVGTTDIYLHADMAIKERALAKTGPSTASAGRFKPSDKLLSFLEGL
jgi:hypothetical protein